MPLRTNAAALLQDDPFLPGRQTTRTTVEGPIGTTTTITETPNAAALVEQVLGRGGLVLVRLAVVAGTAFLAGAVAQRILLASFAIRVAGMEIPEVAQASTATLEQVRTRIDGLSKAINDATSAGERLIERVDLLEFKISHLTERDRPPPTPPDRDG